MKLVLGLPCINLPVTDLPVDVGETQFGLEYHGHEAERGEDERIVAESLASLGDRPPSTETVADVRLVATSVAGQSAPGRRVGGRESPPPVGGSGAGSPPASARSATACRRTCTDTTTISEHA